MRQCVTDVTDSSQTTQNFSVSTSLTVSLGFYCHRGPCSSFFWLGHVNFFFDWL